MRRARYAAIVVRKEMDSEVRLRWRAWLLHFRNERLEKNPSETEKDFADWFHVSQPSINIALRARDPRGPGIDLIIKLSDASGMPLDTMCRKYPHEVFPKYKERSGERTANPSQAFPENANPGRRGGGGRA